MDSKGNKVDVTCFGGVGMNIEVLCDIQHTEEFLILSNRPDIRITASPWPEFLTEIISR